MGKKQRKKFRRKEEQERRLGKRFRFFLLRFLFVPKTTFWSNFELNLETTRPKYCSHLLTKAICYFICKHLPLPPMLFSRKSERISESSLSHRSPVHCFSCFFRSSFSMRRDEHFDDEKGKKLRRTSRSSSRSTIILRRDSKSSVGLSQSYESTGASFVCLRCRKQVECICDDKKRRNRDEASSGFLDRAFENAIAIDEYFLLEETQE